MDRFDKFTDRVRKVLTLAQDEAQRFNHNYIGTEHILLGLIREGEGVAAQVLDNLGVELAKVRMAVEFIIGSGDRPVVGEVGLTPGGKRVIELAIDEARRLGHDYIGTEHLLLGLVREGEGIAAGVLESLGVNLDKVRHEVIRVLSESPRAGTAARRSSGSPGQPFRVGYPATIDDFKAGEMRIDREDDGYRVRAQLTRDLGPDEEGQTAFFKIVGTQRYFVFGFPVRAKSYALDAGPIPLYALGGAGNYAVQVVGADDGILAEGTFRFEPVLD